MSRSGIVCAAAVLLAVGCVDGRRAAGPTPADSDGGSTRTPPPPAPPGGVGVSVASASWAGVGELALEVVVSNAADGRPAPLVYTAFTLETSGGAVLESSSWFGDGCPSGVSVAPGASLGCAIAFVVPDGHAPTRVHYEADPERRALAEVRACGASVPRGLCELGSVCSEGGCVTPCSPSRPDGVCAGTSERCIEGECVGACSSSSPSGWCDDGACYQGRCDASCYTVDLSDPCYDCLSANAESCNFGSSGECFDVEACSYCPLDGTSTCECAQSLDCSGCEADVRAVWSCLADACPVCVG